MTQAFGNISLIFLLEKQESRLLKLRCWVVWGKYHTLLSGRFDRKDEAKRIHFASSMSLLGLKDGDNAQGGYGYLDMVDFILKVVVT